MVRWPLPALNITELFQAQWWPWLQFAIRSSDGERPVHVDGGYIGSSRESIQMDQSYQCTLG